jgi:hypothetical protein
MPPKNSFVGFIGRVLRRPLKREVKKAEKKKQGQKG